MPRYAPTIASTALESMEQHGPQLLDQLARTMVAAGMTKARDPLRAVEAAVSRDVRFLADDAGRWYSLAHQLEGAIFVIRPTALERSHELIVLGDELHLLARLTTPQRGLVGGSIAWQTHAGQALFLPDVDREVLYEFGPAAALEALGAGVADGLREWFSQLGMAEITRSDAALVAFLEDLLWQLVLQGPTGWLPPLRSGELLAIEVRGGLLAPSALDPDAVRREDIVATGDRLAAIARCTIGPDPSWFGPPAVRLTDLLETVAVEAPEILRRPAPLDLTLRRAGLELAGGCVGHLGTNWQEVAQQTFESHEDAWAYDPPGQEAA